MKDLFGGGRDDGGAAEAARIQAEEARRAREQEQARWQAEQERIAKEKAEAEAARAAEEKKRQDALEAARKEQANADAANAATGGANFDSGAAEKARVLAAAQAQGASVGLPGFERLKKKYAQKENGGFNGQSNSIVSQSGFNALQVGGRRYV